MGKHGAGAAEIHQLVIPNQIASLREMTAWLQQRIAAMALPDDVSFNFDLCANEAVANIISYAFPDGGAHQISLKLSRDNKTLSLQIEDDGKPFNPLERPRQAQPASLDEAPIGGLGIDLMRSFMAHCLYRRQQGRNILQLIADLSP